MGRDSLHIGPGRWLARTAVAVGLGIVYPLLARGDDKAGEGPLSAVKEQVGDLVALTLKDKALRVDRAHWDRAGDKDRAKRLEELEKQFLARGLPKEFARRMAERQAGEPGVWQAFDRLRSAVGQAGASSSQSSGGARMQSFHGTGLSASMTVGGTNFELSLREESAGGRSLLVSDDGGGALRIILLDGDRGGVLMLNQRAAGPVRLVDVGDDKPRVLAAASFLDLYAANRDYVHQRLFPLLSRLGIGLPLTPHSGEVVAAVLSLLRGPVGDEEAAKVRGLIARLSGSKFRQRQDAEKALADNFARYQKFISEALADSSLPLEAADRLRKIAAANDQAKRVGDVIGALHLTEDVPYLLELLERTGGADRQAVLTALRKLTKQDLGDDPAAWKKWRAGQ